MSWSKDEIRAEVRRRRDLRDVADLQRAGIRISLTCDILLRNYLRGEMVMCYVSQRGEAPTHDIIRSCLVRGQRICVPWVNPETRMIAASELENFFVDLERGFAGILEPRDTCRRPVEPQGIDILLAPGLAFDSKGTRLGRGSGYYDRFLALFGPEKIKVGLAFSWQIFQEIPTEEHDIPMDLIVTEQGVIPVRSGLLEE
jgi:5-formyltetrahydrofolate cyclo-ligase